MMSDPDSPSCHDAEDRGEGPHDDPPSICQKCGDIAERLNSVLIAPMTMSSPAEWEDWCDRCCNTGPDERDEPTEDELEARRRR